MSAVQVSCAIIESAGKVLVAKRAAGKALAGMWEFPGGKIDPGESAKNCLRREIEEELGCLIEVGAALSPVFHAYSGGSIELIPFRCSLVSGTPQALEHEEITWLEPSAIREIDLAAADEPVLREYLELLDRFHGAS